MAKILYVGTASSECEQLCFLLEQGGHTVETASCAERAMLCVEEKKDYEAMVLHLCYLPGMDGAELCRWIEKHSPIKGVPKVAFTLPGCRMPVDTSNGPPRWLAVDRLMEGLTHVEDLVREVNNLLAERR